jgi:hypothetical protein
MRLILPIFTVVACLPSVEKDLGETGEIITPIDYTFIDDCEEALNDSLETAVDLLAEDGTTHTGVHLCKKEVDYYRFYLPAQSYVSLNLEIEGSGSYKNDKTDLDLLEVSAPDAQVSGLLDMVADEPDQEVDTLWYSASDQPQERLAWFNPTDESIEKWVAIDGFKKSVSTYDLSFRVDEFHEGFDCNEFFSKTGQKGPCNEIMSFPQANNLDDGYVVSHEARYSNLRRELIYLVRWAAAETAATFENTNPIGLLDMSQADGDVPGRQDDQLRHPEGTHVNGNDIDIAYYQTGSNNLGRSVCPENGYFCTAEPDILDAERSAFFISRLMKSEHLRVIGVDTMIYTDLIAAASDLKNDGLLTYNDVQRMKSYLAYGDGWPFHQHHLHFSWDWEDGWFDSESDQGCALPAGLEAPAKLRTGPGLEY